MHSVWPYIGKIRTQGRRLRRSRRSSGAMPAPAFVRYRRAERSNLERSFWSSIVAIVGTIAKPVQRSAARSWSVTCGKAKDRSRTSVPPARKVGSSCVRPYPKESGSTESTTSSPVVPRYRAIERTTVASERWLCMTPFGLPVLPEV
jgi:hypothetical protein